MAEEATAPVEIPVVVVQAEQPAVTEKKGTTRHASTDTKRASNNNKSSSGRSNARKPRSYSSKGRGSSKSAQTKGSSSRQRRMRSKSTKNRKTQSSPRPNPPDPNEHALQTSWTFWFYVKPKASQTKNSYESQLSKLGTFNTIEGFMRYYAHLKRPSELKNNWTLYCFRERFKPMWEMYPNGGCLSIRLKKGSAYLASMWEKLLLGAIGENFADPSVIGVALNVRAKQNGLNVWYRSGKTKQHARKARLEREFKAILDVSQDTIIDYKTNRWSMSQNKSNRSNSVSRSRGNSSASRSNSNAKRRPSGASQGPSQPAKGLVTFKANGEPVILEPKADVSIKTNNETKEKPVEDKKPEPEKKVEEEPAA